MRGGIHRRKFGRESRIVAAAGARCTPLLAVLSVEVAAPTGPQLTGESMIEQRGREDDSGNPQFGRLLIVLLLVVLFCGLLTWVMATYFPDFPNF
jgi:hypothetical protein